MHVERTKTIAAAVGAGATAVLLVLTVGHPGGERGGHYLATSGDSATGTAFTVPTVTPMSISATAMSTGVTTSAVMPMTSEATPIATPTLTTTPEATCTEKGVALPGGCH